MQIFNFSPQLAINEYFTLSSENMTELYGEKVIKTKSVIHIFWQDYLFNINLHVSFKNEDCLNL